jgi:hypothetical protein
LELTGAYGVVEVARVAAGTLYIFLRRDLWPREMKHVWALATEWWPFDRIVLAVRADLRGSGNSQQAG